MVHTTHAKCSKPTKESAAAHCKGRSHKYHICADLPFLQKFKRKKTKTKKTILLGQKIEGRGKKCNSKTPLRLTKNSNLYFQETVKSPSKKAFSCGENVIRNSANLRVKI